jgi:hypothetical protein
MARKAILEEPHTVPSMSLSGLGPLTFALGVAFYFERQTENIGKE